MSDQLNDLQMTALGNEGFTGQLNERMSAWLRSTGAVGTDLVDLWMSFLLLQPGGQRNQKTFNWLGSLGYTETDLPDRQYHYWSDRAAA